MKVNELSKQLGIKNKDLIDFLKGKGFKISSHLQTLTDEQIDLVKDNFSQISSIEEVPVPNEAEVKPSKVLPPKREIRKIDSSEMIECRSVVPWKMVEIGADRTTLYSWNGYGDIEPVSFRDLQSWRKKEIVTDPKIIILDPDICEMWKHDLGNTYQKYLGVEYPEEFFEVEDGQFRSMLEKAPEVFKNVIKYTAMDMIHNENYPSVSKVKIIDEVLGTCIGEFLM